MADLTAGQSCGHPRLAVSGAADVKQLGKESRKKEERNGTGLASTRLVRNAFCSNCLKLEPKHPFCLGCQHSQGRESILPAYFLLWRESSFRTEASEIIQKVVNIMSWGKNKASELRAFTLPSSLHKRA